jgi:BlaI family penicillinase repressor
MNNLPRISEAEWQVMDVLWEHAPRTANDIVDALEHTGWSPKTTKTLLNRLVNKGALSYEKSGRTYLYSPAVDRAPMEQGLVGGLLRGAFQGNADRLVLRALESGDTSPEELEAIKALIARYESNEGATS